MMIKICSFCLSNDRKLTLINEKYWKIIGSCITSEDDKLENLRCLQRKQALQICWECSTKLKKFHQFISMSQHCMRVLNTYLEGPTQTLPATKSKLYRANLQVVDTDSKHEETEAVDMSDTETKDEADTKNTGPMYIKTETEDVTDNLDMVPIYEETVTVSMKDTETEDVEYTIAGPMKTETEDVTDNLDLSPIYEESEMENMTETLDVTMENYTLKNEDIINDIRKDCTSVDLEMINKQLASGRVLVHRLPTDTPPANISGAPVTICDDTNNSWIKEIEDVPRIEAPGVATHCILKPRTMKEYEENLLKKDNKTVFKILDQKKRCSLTYICDHCQQKFNTKMKLQQHISIHYGVSEVNLTCQICNYKSSTVEALKKHSKFHDENRRFKCKFCTYRFISHFHLMLHGPTHTVEKPYKGELCDKKHGMRTHMCKKPNEFDLKGHMGDTYKCDVCDYVSSTSGRLKTHYMRTHMDEKPFKCDLCDYASRFLCDFRNHKRTHGGATYKCDKCDYVSGYSGYLKLHMRKHTSELPIKCDLCGYASRFASRMKSHIKTHTDERPYKCDLCEYRGKEIKRVREHKKRVHYASLAT